MTLWSLLDGGAGTVGTASAGQRFTAWAGRAMASRRKGVTIAKTALIHPEARISARSGALVIGERSEIAPGALIQGDVRIGANSSVQSYAIVVGYGGGPVTIGDGVRIAAHTMIIAANHVFDDPDTAIRLQGLRPAPIVIEDDVWVGGRVTITAGVRIGRGSVIGAGAVVTADLPAGSVAMGVPAKVRARRW